MVRALGIPILEERGTEADDLIGTLARAAKAERFFTVLLAGDKDFMQIVDPQTLLLDTMYDLPSLRNVQKVVVDEQVIEGHNKPYIVHRTEETRLVAPVEETRRPTGSDHL